LTVEPGSAGDGGLAAGFFVRFVVTRVRIATGSA
jgi:hypothetical protein